MPSDQPTERYNDPSSVRYAESHPQCVAVLSWTDTTGDHELTIDGPTTLGSAEGKACIIPLRSRSL